MNIFEDIKLPSVPKDEDLLDLKEELVSQLYDITHAYNKFWTSSKETQKLAEKALISDIDTDPDSLKRELSQLISILSTIGSHLVDSNSFLSIYRIIHFLPKKQKVSETDRRVYTETKTILQTNLYKQLENLKDRLTTKISICQSMLKFETAQYTREKTI